MDEPDSITSDAKSPSSLPSGESGSVMSPAVGHFRTGNNWVSEATPRTATVFKQKW